MSFSERLKELRLERGWTQKGLASRVGVNTTLIGKYERGLNEPGIFSAICLADALGVSLDYLVGRSNKR